MNRLIVAVGSAFTIYVLFFNNALSFLTEVGINMTDNLRVIIGLAGFIFVMAYVYLKSEQGEI